MPNVKPGQKGREAPAVPFDDFLSAEIERVRAENRWRFFRPVTSAQDAHVRAIDPSTGTERELLMLASNNYLGLANDLRIGKAVASSALSDGTGSGASRHISGSMTLHEQLEKRLAAFKGAEAAVLFNTGYMANVGIISALMGPEDAVFSDELNHASIIDGCRMSGAAKEIFRHSDMADLEKRLAASTARHKLIVTDAVFSMDGDLAKLREIADLARRYHAWTMVDEAHATGVFGRSGRGLVEHFGLTGKIDVIMGTLGKSLGGFGAFAAGSRQLVDFLINKSRMLIFTTALPPHVCAGVLAALDIVETEPDRIPRLHRLSARFRDRLSAAGLDLCGSVTPIVPIRIGPEEKTLQIARDLWNEGLFVIAIRPPTVPAGTCRLRTTVMATHTEADLDKAADLIIASCRKHGVIQ